MTTNFRLASVAKQFTAACILLLRERGQLPLETPLASVFPDFPQYGKAVTIRHLLSHTSGLMDYEDVMPPETTIAIQDAGVLDLMRQQTGTYFPPGDQFRYSNSGYVLLGLIVEAVSGAPFPRFLNENIFIPLGMEDAIAFLDYPGAPQVPSRAYGYRKAEGGFEFADQSVTSATLGDGGIYCSPENYLKWHNALRIGALLPPDVIKESITPASANNGEAVPYGLGWRLETQDGRDVAYHPGSTTGFNHGVRWIPSEDLLLFVFANRTAAGSKELAKELESEFLSAANN